MYSYSFKIKFMAIFLVAMSLMALMPTYNLKAYEQEVIINSENFPDNNFRNYVANEMDTNGDSILSAEEISNVKSVNVTDVEVTTLQGIEFFYNLDSLMCNNCGLNEIDVSMNPELIWLCCSGNNLSYIDLSNNEKLIAINLNENNLTSIDVSMCVRLDTLSISNNPIVEIDLSQNTSLWTFACSGTELSSLNLWNCTRLCNITVFDCPIEVLDVSHNPQIAEAVNSDYMLPGNFNGFECNEYIHNGSMCIVGTDIEIYTGLESPVGDEEDIANPNGNSEEDLSVPEEHLPSEDEVVIPEMDTPETESPEEVSGDEQEEVTLTSTPIPTPIPTVEPTAALTPTPVEVEQETIPESLPEEDPIETQSGTSTESSKEGAGLTKIAIDSSYDIDYMGVTNIYEGLSEAKQSMIGLMLRMNSTFNFSGNVEIMYRDGRNNLEIVLDSTYESCYAQEEISNEEFIAMLYEEFARDYENLAYYEDWVSYMEIAESRRDVYDAFVRSGGCYSWAFEKKNPDWIETSEYT